MTRTWLGHDSGVGAIGGGPGGAGYMLVSGFDSGSTLDHPRRILRVALVSHPPPLRTPRAQTHIRPRPCPALPSLSSAPPKPEKAAATGPDPIGEAATVAARGACCILQCRSAIRAFGGVVATMAEWERHVH